MATRAERFAQISFAQHDAGRESARDPFSQGEDIRLNAVVLMRKQLACTAHTGLHFIHDQEQAMLLAERYYFIQELLLYF
ncbi:hypothetical protein D3C73_1481170 [compost metagenome]